MASSAHVSGFLEIADAGTVKVVSVGRLFGRKCVRLEVDMPGKQARTETLYAGDTVSLSLHLDLEPLGDRP